MQYVNDGWCLSGDKTPELEQLRQVQKNTAELYQTQSSDIALDLTTFHIPVTCRKRNIDYGEELYVEF